MTVSTATSRSGPYAGAGTTGPFTVNFRFLDASHLEVIRTDVTGEHVLVLSTDYTVAGVGNPTGSVTLIAALPVGETLTIIRDVPVTQEADYVQNDDFPAQSHEDVLDKLTMISQQLGEAQGRSLTLPASSPSGVSAVLPVPAANQLIAWNSAATGLQNADPSTIATIVAFGTAKADLFSGTGAQTAFTLTASPGSQANLDVSIGGVTQRTGIDYTWLSGTTLTFTTPPPLGTNNILARYLQGLPQGVADLSATVGSLSGAQVTFIQAGVGAVSKTAQEKARESVSVFDFMSAAQIADVKARTVLLDVTAAFAAAQAASKNVKVPSGSYLVDGVRIQTGVSLIGEGYDNTIFVQKTNGTPAINCLSDATTGQLLSVNLSQFGVTGKTGATVAAVMVAAFGAFAIFKSNFDFTVNGGFRSLEMQGATSDNVFHCSFKVVGIDTTNTTVLLNGGAYNTFDLFLSQCQNGKALDETTTSSYFSRLVTEGQLLLRGSSIYNNPTVENIVGTALSAGSAVIQCTGSSQTLITPNIILSAASSVKATYAFQTFTNTLLIQPRIRAQATLLHPFGPAFGQKCTIIGPGQSSCPNKIEAVYLDTNDSAQNMRTFSMVGDCSAFTSGNTPHGGKTLQYMSGPGTGAKNIQALNNTDALVVDFAAACTANISPGYFPVHNQVLSIYAKTAFTAITWVPRAGENMTYLPAAMAAGERLSMVYSATNNAWYPI